MSTFLHCRALAAAALSGVIRSGIPRAKASQGWQVSWASVSIPLFARGRRGEWKTWWQKLVLRTANLGKRREEEESSSSSRPSSKRPGFFHTDKDKFKENEDGGKCWPVQLVQGHRFLLNLLVLLTSPCALCTCR